MIVEGRIISADRFVDVNRIRELQRLLEEIYAKFYSERNGILTKRQASNEKPDLLGVVGESNYDTENHFMKLRIFVVIF